MTSNDINEKNNLEYNWKAYSINKTEYKIIKLW
jgi:hypothetical protein